MHVGAGSLLLSQGLSSGQFGSKCFYTHFTLSAPRETFTLSLGLGHYFGVGELPLCSPDWHKPHNSSASSPSSIYEDYRYVLPIAAEFILCVFFESLARVWCICCRSWVSLGCRAFGEQGRKIGKQSFKKHHSLLLCAL